MCFYYFYSVSFRLNLDFVVVARVGQEFQFWNFVYEQIPFDLIHLFRIQSFYFIHGADREGEKESKNVGTEWL